MTVSTRADRYALAALRPGAGFAEVAGTEAGAHEVGASTEGQKLNHWLQAREWLLRFRWHSCGSLSREGEIKGPRTEPISSLSLPLPTCY